MLIFKCIHTFTPHNSLNIFMRNQLYNWYDNKIWKDKIHLKCYGKSDIITAFFENEFQTEILT